MLHVRGYSAVVEDRLATIKAIRERLAEGRPQLNKAFAAARLRCEAVMLDAVATVERCRSAQLRRATHRRENDIRGHSPDGDDNGKGR